jgi:hypothetical protein
LQGLSLFHVLLRPIEDENERKKATASYDLAMSSGSSLTTLDTVYFNHPGTIHTSWVEPIVAKVTLKNMWALCTTIMGDTHTVSVGLQLALQRWDQYEMTLHDKYHCSPDTWTMEFLYWFHRQLSQWIRAQAESRNPIPFECDELFHNISLGDAWSRGLPTQYVPARLLLNPTSSAISQLTAAPAPAPAPAPQADKTPTGIEKIPVSQPASHTVPRLAAFAEKRQNRKLGSIVKAAFDAGNHVPKDKDGGAFCMSYHITGNCWSNCARARNHRKLTDAEITSVATWCDLAF